MAANTDNLMKVGLASATTLDSNYTINDTTVTVASTAGWPSDTGVTFAIDVIDSQGVQVPGTYNEYVGTVATGTSISNVDWADGNADRNYTAGATTRVYIPVSKTRENRIVTWGLVHGNQDGTLKTDVAVTTANATLTSPKVITGINDTNGNELLKVTATASAVNELTLANAATGNAPVLSATGGDTNVDITLTPKGTGVVNLTKWSNPYKFLVYRNAAYNQPAAATVFPFDTEVFDTNNNFDVTTNVGRYTAPVTGYYHFTVQTIIACTSGDHIIPELYVDGSLYTRLGEQRAAASTNLAFGGTAMVYMTAGQYIEAKYAITTLRGCLVGNKAYCWFTGHLISMT